MQDGTPPPHGGGPEYQPPASQPPQYQQPGQQPPGYQPPASQPPQYQRPGQQPPGYQPPGQPYGGVPPTGAPPKKKMSGCLLAVLLVGSVVLAVGGCIGFFAYRAVSEVNRSNDFLAAWADGDYDEVATLLEPSCGITADELRELLGDSEITGYNIGSVEVINGVTSTAGTITADGFDQRSIEIEWRNDKVCGLSIGAA